MNQNRESYIDKLFENWMKEAIKEDGSIVIGQNTEQYRLLRNGIDYSTLDYSEMKAVSQGLSRVLLLRGMNVIIDYDHFFYWAWTAELILNRSSSYFELNNERHIEELFSSTIRLALAGVKRPVRDKNEWQKQIEISKQMEFNAQQLIYKNTSLLAYIVFPLLEAVVKKHCSEYVDYSGRIIKYFKIKRINGKYRHYNPGDICSSVRDLLFLLYNYVASNDLKDQLSKFRTTMTTYSVNKDPFDLIYSWRNSSLHGAECYPTIGGTLLNLSILIMLSSFEVDYVQARDEVLKKIMWEVQTGQLSQSRSPWSYYPPF